MNVHIHNPKQYLLTIDSIKPLVFDKYILLNYFQ